MPDEIDDLSGVKEEPRAGYDFLRTKGAGGNWRPAKFHLHRKLTLGQKDQLKDIIMMHGGTIVDNPATADTIITSRERIDIVSERYAHTKIQVKDSSFVKKCLKRQGYIVEAQEKKPMSGRQPGSERQRTEFTKDDIANLVTFLRKMIPDVEDGGRSGANLYKELCDPIRKKDYPWAERHTWQSWMSYYKRHTNEVDAAIAEAQKRFPRDALQRGEYRWSRKNTKRNQASLRGEEETPSEGEDEDEQRETTSRPARHMATGNRALTVEPDFLQLNRADNDDIQPPFDYNFNEGPDSSPGMTLVGTQQGGPSDTLAPQKDKGKGKMRAVSEVLSDVDAAISRLSTQGSAGPYPERQRQKRPHPENQYEKISAVTQTSEREVANEVLLVLESDTESDHEDEEESQETQDPDFPPTKKGRHNPEQRPRIGPGAKPLPPPKIQMSTRSANARSTARTTQAGPSRQRQTSEHRESSVESEFPPDGTRARMASDSLRKQETRQSYVPLRGTRASQVVRV